MQAITGTLAMLLALVVPGAGRARRQYPVTARHTTVAAAAMCRHATCQHNVRIVLSDRDGSTFDRTFPVFTPVIQGTLMTVVPGQTIHVEADIVGGRLAHLHAVPMTTHPARTVTARLLQTRDHGMLLAITNPFDRPLKFHMGIMPLDRPDAVVTSSCPVAAHGTSYESWSYPVFQVFLGAGRLLADSDSRACTN